MKPQALVDADAAIKRTEARAGPTHGVQAKLKVNPIRNAVAGDMASALIENGSRYSRPPKGANPNSPSLKIPRTITSIPPILANHTLFVPKNWPAAENPNPRTKKAKLTPATKHMV